LKSATNERKKATIAQPVKMRGLYRRGKIFWYTKMVDGSRTCVSLGTEAEGDAIRQILKIRQSPDLAPTD
jgi:hypothetical protein